MNTTNNSHIMTAVAACGFALLLLTSSAVSAKDIRSRTQNSPSSVSAPEGNDRGIIIVSGKKEKNAANKVDVKKIRQGTKINPGGPVELNPQPLPPKTKASQRRIKINPGEAVGLNPQPLPPGQQ
jgi:hypothetical protein